MKVTDKTVFIELQNNTKKETFAINEDEEITIVFLVTQSTDYQIEILLNGTNAVANIIGLVIAQAASIMKIHSLQKHVAGNTLSDLHIKSILTDQAQFYYEGYIQIDKNAQRSNAYQRNDNLLLSAQAKAESKPALEILANDVRCTHGATLGKIDPDQLFYLQSRGLSKKGAQELIIHGFFQTLIDKIPDKKIQQQVLKKIEAVL